MHESFDLQYLDHRKSTSGMLQMVGANQYYINYQNLNSSSLVQNIWSAQTCEYEMVRGKRNGL